MEYIAMVESIEGVPQYQFLWKELPLEERIPAAAKAGFSGVDYWDWIDKDIDRLAQIAKDNGIFVNSVFGSRRGSLCDTADHEKILEQFKESLDMAERTGVKALFLQTDEVGHGGIVVPHSRPLTDKERWEQLDEGVKKVTELVASSGVDVDLLIEPLSQDDVQGYLLRSASDTYELVKRIDYPRLKFVFDLYHQQINEGNIINNLRRTIDKAGAIHIANVPGRGMPGSGEIDIHAIWREMQALGWDGPVGFECVPGNHTTEETLAGIKTVFPFPPPGS